MSLEFSVFRAQANKAKKVNPFSGRLLALDPGETTGWSIFDCYPPLPSAIAGQVALAACGQLDTWPIGNAIDNLSTLLEAHKPTFMVHESYHVYKWKTQDHTWSEVPTVQVIGVIATLAHQRIPPLVVAQQTAQQAKNFVTDSKLREWGFYQRGQRHARDSIRHACYYLLFGTAHAT